MALNASYLPPNPSDPGPSAGKEPRGRKRELLAANMEHRPNESDNQSVRMAREGLERLRLELGDARFKILQEVAGRFHEIFVPLVEEAKELGLFSEEIWKERIEINLRNHVPRMVLD